MGRREVELSLPRDILSQKMYTEEINEKIKAITIRALKSFNFGDHFNF